MASPHWASKVQIQSLTGYDETTTAMIGRLAEGNWLA